MEYKTSYEEPTRVLTKAPKRYYRFDIEQDGEEWKYQEVELNVFTWDYEHLVSAIVRAKYSQDDVEAIVLNGDTEALAELNEWRNKAKDLAASQFGIVETIEGAKALKIRAIEAYDTSEEVNSFTMSGQSVWVDKATRVGLVNSTNMLKQIGEENTTLWLGNVSMTLPCDVVLGMLCQIEVYALACYNVTAQHKAAVSAMTDIESIKAYDYTKGYPTKLAF